MLYFIKREYKFCLIYLIIFVLFSSFTYSIFAHPIRYSVCHINEACGTSCTALNVIVSSGYARLAINENVKIQPKKYIFK